MNFAGTPADNHRTATIWGTKVESGYFEQVSTLVWDIEVTSGAFSSDPLAEETVAAASNSPCEIVYWGEKRTLPSYLRSRSTGSETKRTRRSTRGRG